MVTRKEVEEVVDTRLSEQADVIQESFNQVEDKFQEVYKRFDQVDIRFDRLEKKLEQMDGKIGGINFTMNRILDLLGAVKGDQQILEKRVNRWEQFYPLPT